MENKMGEDGDMIVESYMAKKALGITDKPLDIKYIVAGSFSEYTDFLNRDIENGISSRVIKGQGSPYRYVFIDIGDGGILAKAEKIQGYFVGTWADRPDIEGIQRIIKQKKDIEKDQELELKIRLEESKYG
jgi:hypothetical protein